MTPLLSPASIRRFGLTALMVAALSACGSNDDVDGDIPRDGSNTPPQIIGQLQNYTIPQGDQSSETRDLRAVFFDPDGDTLSYSTTSTQPDDVRANATSTGVLSVTVLDPTFAGLAIITVTAADGRGGTESTTFSVVVQSGDAGNEPPQQIAELPDQQFTTRDTEGTLNGLSPSFFVDPDNDALSFSAQSDTTEVVVANIGADDNSVRMQIIGPGQATITVTAVDTEGQSVTGQYGVVVVRPNPEGLGSQDPQDIRIAEGERAAPLDLSQFFLTNPNSGDLVYEASSSRPNVVVARVDDGRLLIFAPEAAVPKADGDVAVITVIARDERGATGQIQFEVLVDNTLAPTSACDLQDVVASDSEARPRFAEIACLTGTGTDLNATTPTQLELNTVFDSPAQLNFEASSTNPDSVRVSRSGGVLRVTLTEVDGVATVAVTARDPEGNTAYQEFEVANDFQTDPVSFGEFNATENRNELPTINVTAWPRTRKFAIELADFVADADPSDADEDPNPADAAEGSYTYTLTQNTLPQLLDLTDPGVSQDNFGRLTLEVDVFAAPPEELPLSGELSFRVSDDDGDVTNAVLTVNIVAPVQDVYAVSASLREVLRFAADAQTGADPTGSFDLDLNAGIALSESGSLFQAGLDTATTPEAEIRVLFNALQRAEDAADDRASYDAALDRELATQSDALAGVVPRNLLLEPDSGLLIALHTDADSDNGDFPAVQVYAPQAGAAATPLLSIPLSTLHAADATEFADVWDAVYTRSGDAEPVQGAVTDALFISMTDGRIIRCDAFLASFEAGLAPQCRAADDSVQAIVPDVGDCIDAGSTSNNCVNLHGIDYVAASDTLVVSDVGPEIAAGAGQDPGFDNDGSIYVFHNIGSQLGAVVPDLIIRKQTADADNLTALGNPVDLSADGVDLLVAEKANAGGAVLRYNGVLDVEYQPPANNAPIVPDAVLTVEAAEIVRVLERPDAGADLSDGADRQRGAPIVDLAERTEAVLVAGPQSIQRVVVGLGDEDAPLAPQPDAGVEGSTDTGSTILGLDIDAAGSIVGTVDSGPVASAPGGLVITGTRTAGTALGDANSRAIFATIAGGTRATLQAPKGLDVVAEAGVAFVADFRLANQFPLGRVEVYNYGTEGDVAAAFTIDLPNRRPWDVDYDPVADRLFVALTNGRVLIIDDVLATEPTDDSGARLVRPAQAGAALGRNLHGINHHRVYDADGGVLYEELILSDVGNVGNGTDGAIYVLSAADMGAANFTGLQEVDLSIEGLSEADAEIANCDIDGVTANDAAVLGNPVDLAYSAVDDSVFVVDKSTQALVHIRLERSVLTGRADDFVASCAALGYAPEAVQLLPNYLPPFNPDLPLD